MAKILWGSISQVQGPVVDVKFSDELPGLRTAIEIDNAGNKLVVEVAQHVGDDTVRCISMGPTEGLVRGLSAKALNEPISVPVGNAKLGRLFNVLGETIDGKEEVVTDMKLPIHRQAPSYDKQNTPAPPNNPILPPFA